MFSFEFVANLPKISAPRSHTITRKIRSPLITISLTYCPTLRSNERLESQTCGGRRWLLCVHVTLTRHLPLSQFTASLNVLYTEFDVYLKAYLVVLTSLCNVYRDQSEELDLAQLPPILPQLPPNWLFLPPLIIVTPVQYRRCCLHLQCNPAAAWHSRHARKSQVFPTFSNCRG